MLRYKNVRIEVVSREGEKDWAETGRYLSVRSYRENGQLLMGPDIPIESDLSDDQIKRLMHASLVVYCGVDNLPPTP